MRIIKIKNDSGATQTVLGKVLSDQELLEISTYESLEQFRKDDTLMQLVSNQELIVQDSEGDITTTAKALKWIFEDNPSEVEIKKQSESAPFASKTLPDGRKLFKRVHGKFEIIPANGQGTIEFELPYESAKVNGLELIGGSKGDQADFNVYDNALGVITSTLAATGYTAIPGFKLNQFGFDVCVAPGYHEEISQYDADLIQGMKLEVLYKNSSNEDALIGINFIIHEVRE